MPDYIGHKPGPIENFIQITLIVLFGVVMFVLLTQPAWRGDEMIAELKSDCQKRHGVMLEHKKMFGTSYECASRLDK